MQVEAQHMWGGWWPLLTTNVMSEITLSPVRLRRSHTDEGWCKHAVIWPDSLTAAGSILIVERPPRTQILGNICKRGIEPQTTNLATLFLQKTFMRERNLTVYRSLTRQHKNKGKHTAGQ